MFKINLLVYAMRSLKDTQQNLFIVNFKGRENKFLYDSHHSIYVYSEFILNDWLTVLQALIGYKQQFLIGLCKNFAETWIRISYSRKFSIFVLIIFEFCCIPLFVLITIPTYFVLGLFKTIWMNSTFSGKQTIQHLTSRLPFSLLLILLAWFEYTLYLMFSIVLS